MIPTELENLSYLLNFPDKWETKTVKSLCLKTTSGGTPSRKNPDFYKNGNIIWLKTKELKEWYIKDSEEKITEEALAKSSAKLFPKNTILMAMYGDGRTITSLGILRKSAATNQACCALIPNPEIINFIYLFYLLKFHKEHLIKLALGGAQRNLSVKIISDFKVKVSPLSTQQKIAGILSAYDDLIENNTRRIEILEEMARMLYREWFVKFRFPGHEAVQFVESELGLIPEGWEVVKIENFGKVITGKTPSKTKPEYYGSYMPFIKTPSMHGKMFCIEVEEYLSKEGADSQRHKSLPPNTLIVNCIGALAGSVSITSEFSQTNQQINAVILNNIKNREFLYFLLVELKETIRQYGSTGATMINLSKGKFESLSVLSPNRIILNQFNQLTASKFELIKNLQLKNINLRKTRDLLLPRLISGEIDVENLAINTGI